jgi:hypothetical protein
VVDIYVARFALVDPAVAAFVVFITGAAGKGYQQHDQNQQHTPNDSLHEAVLPSALNRTLAALDYTLSRMQCPT